MNGKDLEEFLPLVLRWSSQFSNTKAALLRTTMLLFFTYTIRKHNPDDHFLPCENEYIYKTYKFCQSSFPLSFFLTVYSSCKHLLRDVISHNPTNHQATDNCLKTGGIGGLRPIPKLLNACLY